jgi:hypothetical protein
VFLSCQRSPPVSLSTKRLTVYLDLTCSESSGSAFRTCMMSTKQVCCRAIHMLSSRAIITRSFPKGTDISTPSARIVAHPHSLQRVLSPCARRCPCPLTSPPLCACSMTHNAHSFTNSLRLPPLPSYYAASALPGEDCQTTHHAIYTWCAYLPPPTCMCVVFLTPCSAN